VQEQAITTLAMVADASEATFAKVRSLRLRLCDLTVLGVDTDGGWMGADVRFWFWFG
jgi:hypothetical protein